MADAGSGSYDGFLSYSHAADDLLAPRLQAGLQRFAKPWWKRRALHIFRDEASLSANPHLWSSITDALDDSQWFVLLLSPEAAQSEWVNREIDYWKEHRDPQRILPVVTDGTFGWSDEDVTGDAAPAALQGVFEGEPRWVDLRFAHSDEQLDLKNPRFSAAVADLASAIRGMPRDELESEEIRQHRRTVRTAWTAGAAILALGVAASVGAVVAFNAQQDAQDQRDQAQQDRDRAITSEQRATEERDRAIDAEDEAERQQTIAEQERDRAEELAGIAQANADLALSREWAASAISVLDEDPELSLLLAIEAAEITEPTFEAVSALHEAILQHRKLASYEVDGWVGTILTADGSRVVTLDDLTADFLPLENPKLEGRDASSGELLWSEELPGLTDWFFSPMQAMADGRHVVMPAVSVAGGIYRVDADTGDWELLEIDWPCPIKEIIANGHGIVDPGPMWLLVPAPIAEGRCSENEVAFLEVSSDGATTVLARLGEDNLRSNPAAGVRDLSVSGDGSRLAYMVDGETTVLDLETRQTVNVLQGVGHWLNEDGSLVGFGRGMLWDTTTGEIAVQLERIGDEWEWARFTPDGTRVFSDTLDQFHMWDVASGDRALSVPVTAVLGSVHASLDGKFLGKGQRVHTVWDTTPRGETRLVALPEASYPSSNLDLVERGIGAVTQWDEATLVTFDITGGAITGEIAEITAQDIALSHDGKLIAAQRGTSNGPFGPVQIFDTATREVMITMAGWCEWDVFDEIVSGPDCRDYPDQPFPAWTYQLEFSPDDTRLAATTGGGYTVRLLVVWDVSTGAIEHVAQLDQIVDLGDGSVNLAWDPSGTRLALAPRFHSTDQLIVLETETWTEVKKVGQEGDGSSTSSQIRFTPDGRHLVHAGLQDQTITVFDTQNWSEATIALGGLLNDLEVSPDGSLIAAARTDGYIDVLQVDGLLPVQRIPVEASESLNVEFIDDSHLLYLAGGPGFVLTLDVDELIQIGASRLTRQLTSTECETYHIDPCPDPAANQGE